MSRRILVIEDDKDMAHLVELNLKDTGYEVSLVHDSHDGLDQACSKHFDLIILDLMLPERDGLEICRRVRVGSVYTPILMLTATSSELDRVLGLQIGADDYLTKPFSFRELLARVRALFRRFEVLKAYASSEPQKMIHAADLVLDVEKRKVMLRGKSVFLTAKEFDLLRQFANHPGRVYTRSQLLELVWGYKYEGYEHTVNSHINRLRAKIEKNPAKPKYILTVWGIGYKFSDSEISKKG